MQPEGCPAALNAAGITEASVRVPASAPLVGLGIARARLHRSSIQQENGLCRVYPYELNIVRHFRETRGDRTP